MKHNLALNLWLVILLLHLPECCACRREPPYSVIPHHLCSIKDVSYSAVVVAPISIPECVPQLLSTVRAVVSLCINHRLLHREGLLRPCPFSEQQ